MATLRIEIHPKARLEINNLAHSADEAERLSAAHIVTLLDLVRSHTDIRDRILGHYESIWITTPDGPQNVSIKIIQSLKDIANDTRYHTDAIRRIRDVTNSPGNKYRVFFAPGPSKGGAFVFRVLGIFHKESAYSKYSLNELKKRYEEI